MLKLESKVSRDNILFFLQNHPVLGYAIASYGTPCISVADREFRGFQGSADLDESSNTRRDFSSLPLRQTPRPSSPSREKMRCSSDTKKANFRFSK